MLKIYYSSFNEYFSFITILWFCLTIFDGDRIFFCRILIYSRLWKKYDYHFRFWVVLVEKREIQDLPGSIKSLKNLHLSFRNPTDVPRKEKLKHWKVINEFPAKENGKSIKNFSITSYPSGNWRKIIWMTILQFLENSETDDEGKNNQFWI